MSKHWGFLVSVSSRLSVWRAGSEGGIRGSFTANGRWLISPRQTAKICPRMTRRLIVITEVLAEAASSYFGALGKEGLGALSHPAPSSLQTIGEGPPLREISMAVGLSLHSSVNLGRCCHTQLYIAAIEIQTGQPTQPLQGGPFSSEGPRQLPRLLALPGWEGHAHPSE